MGRKHCRKRRIAHYKQFLLFPQCFEKTVLQTCKNQGLFGKGLKAILLTDNLHTLIIPFQNKPWFLHFCRTSLLKTLLEKEKLLVMSNFSFPTVFFTSMESFLPFLSNLKLSSANSFSLKESKICCLGKG